MDNVGFHKTKKILNYLDSKDINPVFTVPYTPDLNPIENVFSIIKRKLQKSDYKSYHRLKKVIDGAMPSVTSANTEKMYRRSFGLISKYSVLKKTLYFEINANNIRVSKHF